MPDSLAPWLNDPTQMSPMTNIGLQLLANSNTPGGFGSIFGKSALAAGQDYQNAQFNQLKIQQLQQQMQQQAFLQQLARQAMGGQPQTLGDTPGATQGQAPQAPTGPAPQGPAAPWMSQGGAPSPQPGAQPQSPSQGVPPSWLTPPSQQDIAGSSAYGSNPSLMRVSALMKGDYGPATEEGIHKLQMQAIQQQLAPKLQTLSYLAKNATPTKFMQADQGLMSAWPQLATQAGLDPQKDFTDDGVRHAVTFAHNQIASSIGATPLPETNRLITKGIQQIDPVTGKVEHEEKLQPIIGPNGQPVLVPESQAIGKTPYNQSQYGAANISDQTKEMAFQFANANGGKLPPWMNSRGDAAKSAMANYIAKRAAEEGDTATSMVAQGQATQAAGNVVKDFTTGKTSQTLNGLNTAIKHMNALDPLIDAMGNGNLTILNKASNIFKQQTGNAAPTNFAALKEFVAGEVAKAVLPGGGGEGERQALAAPINAANSPQQLKQAVEQYRTALAGKTEALRNQWDVGTNGTQGSFDKFLLPDTKKALGIGSAPTQAPAMNSKGWALHTDKNGNRAYVSPDGKSFEEVK